MSEREVRSLVRRSLGSLRHSQESMELGGADEVDPVSYAAVAEARAILEDALREDAPTDRRAR